jgi:hypothetical protein
MDDGMSQTSPIEYPFLGASESNGYRVFPNELENDPLVAFHGTARMHLPSILDHGFAFMRTLVSLSFAKGSPLALKYACEARTSHSPDGCILAVRFDSLERPGIVVEHSIIHVYKLDEQPVVIGYCVIPTDYQFA